MLCIWKEDEEFFSYHVFHKTTEKKYLFHKLLPFIAGYQFKKKERKTFQDCQMCRKNDCCFISCHYLLNSSIFCQNISDTSQHQVTANITMSNEYLTTSTLMSTHCTSDELFASTSSTGNYDTNQSPSSNDTQKMSSNFVLSHKLKHLLLYSERVYF